MGSVHWALPRQLGRIQSVTEHHPLMAHWSNALSCELARDLVTEQNRTLVSITEFWLSMLRDWLLRLQATFDRHWVAGYINVEGWKCQPRFDCDA